MYSYSLQRVRRYTHTRGLAGSDGGSRDLWLPREVTQRLIYFTGVRPPPPLLLHRFSATISTEAQPYTPPVSPPPPLFPRGSRGSVHHRRGSALRALKGPAADIVPHTRPVSRLYTQLHRIYMRKESPPPFPPRFARDPPFPPAPDRAPLGAPSSVNTVHHYRQGAYISKGTALASLRLSPVTLDTILPPSSALSPYTVVLFILGSVENFFKLVATNFYLRIVQLVEILRMIVFFFE